MLVGERRPARGIGRQVLPLSHVEAARSRSGPGPITRIPYRGARFSVVKPIPSYLKLVTATFESPTVDRDDWGGLADCCRAFEAGTGWRLEVVPGKPPAQDPSLVWTAPVDPGVGTSPGHIRLLSDAVNRGARPQVALPAAKELAGALAGVWNELLRTRRALWQREAELAAGVPVAARPDEQQHLAARLESVLAAGCTAVGCQSAGLYLLDGGTSELKLRASWRLPASRLVEPARPLRGAAADLEALLGHAVVLSEPEMFRYWRVPEPCAAAVCLPVSSPTTPLGTLWVFSTESRDFTATETNLLEIVTGRLAAELEREMLLGEVDSLRIARPAAAELLLPAAVPPSPAIDGWDIAGWSGSPASARETAELTAGAWCDWFQAASDQFAVSLGTAAADLNGAAAAAAARTALRTAADMARAPADLLARLNSALWSGEQGSGRVGLVYALVDTHHGVVRLSQCGGTGAMAVRGTNVCPAETVSGTLGAQERLSPGETRWKLAAGDILAAWGGCPSTAGAAQAAESLLRGARLPAASLAAQLGSVLAKESSSGGPWATLVVRRANK